MGRCVHSQCLLCVEGMTTLHLVHLLYTSLPEANPGTLPESTGWTHQGRQVGSNNSFLTQAHHCTQDGEAALWFSTPGYLNRGLHPVITVACYILCPPGTINRQILLLEAALSQEVEIIMPSRHWVSATVWRRVSYVGVGGGVHVPFFGHRPGSFTWGRRGCWEMLI